MEEIVFDLEGDGLNPTKIHCVSFQTKNGLFTTTDYDQMRSAFLKAEYLVGHNICRFDVPVLENLLGIKIKAKLIDTLALSWYLQPNRNRHGLATYGDDFGIEKPVVEDWESQDVSVYINRCEQDVRINTHLWNAQYAKLIEIYETLPKLLKFLEYIQFKMECARLAEESGWKVDIEFTQKQLDKLKLLQQEKVEQLRQAMPRIPVIVKKARLLSHIKQMEL